MREASSLEAARSAAMRDLRSEVEVSRDGVVMVGLFLGGWVAWMERRCGVEDQEDTGKLATEVAIGGRKCSWSMNVIRIICWLRRVKGVRNHRVHPLTPVHDDNIGNELETVGN
jgi:hypothetical protein